MRYDKELQIGESAIVSNVRILNALSSFDVTLEAWFLDNLPEGITYNFAISQVNIEFLDAAGTIIPGTNKLGYFINSSSEDGYFKTNIFSSESLVLPLNTVRINIRGRIYISTNKYYSINQSIIINNPKEEYYIATYFSNP